MWSLKMLAVTSKIKREDLFQEIFAVFRQWPELEQRIFSQAHYHGQSLEAISRSLQLDVEEVGTILKQCDRRLYASLRNFHSGSSDKPALTPVEIARIVARSQDLKGIPVLASKACNILESSQMAV
jgi:hypothetical protein